MIAQITREDRELEIAAVSESVLDVVQGITFEDWRFTVLRKGEELFLQITFEDGDTGLTQYCRLWHLWQGIDESGIVKTAWAAVMAALEHGPRVSRTGASRCSTPTWTSIT